MNLTCKRSRNDDERVNLYGRKAIHEAGFDDFCQAGSINRFRKMNIVAESAALGKRFWFCVDGGYGVKDTYHISIRDLSANQQNQWDECVNCATQEEMVSRIYEIRNQILAAKAKKQEDKHEQ